MLLQLSEVTDGGLLCTAVLAPLSPSAALLSLLVPDVAQQLQFLTSGTTEPSWDLPDVVSSVLGVVYDIMDHSDGAEGEDGRSGDHPVPEWAQQEPKLHPVTGGVLERWFPLSDQSGVSPHLMESMR